MLSNSSFSYRERALTGGWGWGEVKCSFNFCKTDTDIILLTGPCLAHDDIVNSTQQWGWGKKYTFVVRNRKKNNHLVGCYPHFQSEAHCFGMCTRVIVTRAKKTGWLLVVKVRKGENLCSTSNTSEGGSVRAQARAHTHSAYKERSDEKF